MAQNFQITQVAQNGNATVFHPESNADLILTGSTYRVPTINQITDWDSKSTEVVNARKGESNLKAKIDKIDLALTPQELLRVIKTVDGSNSGLDADLVDGCGVNDDTATSSNLWTANRTQMKLNEKVNSSDVVTSSTANKILKLNNNGDLPASVTGNANTATALARTLSMNFGGDVTGTTSFTGKEGSINVNLEIKDNSHTHTSLGAVSVDDTKQDALSLWTALKVSQELSNLAKEGIAYTDAMVKTKDNEISIGGLKIKYGTIDVKNKNTVDLEFETPFEKIFFSNHCCETSDVNLVANIVPGTITNSGMMFNLNTVALDGNLNWFAVGI